MIDNGTEIAEQAQFVPLTSEQLADAEAKLDAALGTQWPPPRRLLPRPRCAPRRRWQRGHRAPSAHCGFCLGDHDIRHHLRWSSRQSSSSSRSRRSTSSPAPRDAALPGRRVRSHPAARGHARDHVLGVPRRHPLRPRHGDLSQPEYATPACAPFSSPLSKCWRVISTVVYGYFALTFFTPFLRDVGVQVETFNALSAGLIMGVMLIPLSHAVRGRDVRRASGSP